MSRRKDLVVLMGVLLAFAAVNLWLFWSGRAPRTREGIGVVLAAGVTLAIFSFLYRDNPVFKAVEHLYVGVGLGYAVVIGWFQFLKPDVFDPLVRPAVMAAIGLGGTPKWSLLAPSVLGVFMVLRIVPRLAWLSRWSVAFIMGAGAGMAIPLTISAHLLKQSWATMMPLISWTAGSPASIEWNASLILVGVVCVLSYFFFSVEHKGIMAVTSRVGIWYLMISFGASFGFTVMARVSLLTGRFQFLMHDWLRVIE